jgi:hypothetical protein
MARRVSTSRRTSRTVSLSSSSFAKLGPRQMQALAKRGVQSVTLKDTKRSISIQRAIAIKQAQAQAKPTPTISKKAALVSAGGAIGAAGISSTFISRRIVQQNQAKVAKEAIKLQEAAPTPMPMPTPITEPMPAAPTEPIAEPIIPMITEEKGASLIGRFVGGALLPSALALGGGIAAGAIGAAVLPELLESVEPTNAAKFIYNSEAYNK